MAAIRSHHLIDPDCVLLEGGDPTTLPGFREGWFAIQDHASAFVVRVLDPRPGEAHRGRLCRPGREGASCGRDRGAPPAAWSRQIAANGASG